MNKISLPATLGFIAIAAALYYFFPIDQMDFFNRPQEQYTILKKHPQGKPVVKMHESFNNGSIFFQLNDEIIAWNETNFIPRHVNSSIFISDISRKVLRHFTLVRQQMINAFETGEAFNPLDDTIFAWNTFFYDEDEEDDEE